MRTGVLIAAWLLTAQSGLAASSSDGVFKRATWLEEIERELYLDVQKQFRTRYDGSIWARACRENDIARRLQVNRRDLGAWVFDRLLAKKAAAEISPTEKWMVVKATVNMTISYVEGGAAFVRPSREDCRIVIKGLIREFGN